jgi:hypothetical protein
MKSSSVAVFMDGRDKTSCEYRYTRTLWDKLRHGRWTEPEDMVNQPSFPFLSCINCFLILFLAAARGGQQIWAPELGQDFRMRGWPLGNPVQGSVGSKEDKKCHNYSYHYSWVHVLDHKRRNLPWGWEEYMRLLHGVRFFGRDECARIAKMIPGRNNMDVRMRIRLLVNCQIKVLLVNRHH